jgi:hypothetical protein
MVNFTRREKLKSNKRYKVWDKRNQCWCTNSNRKTSSGTWSIRGAAINQIYDQARGWRGHRDLSDFELVTVEVVEKELDREDGELVYLEQERKRLEKEAEDEKHRKIRELARKKEEIERLQREVNRMEGK